MLTCLCAATLLRFFDFGQGFNCQLCYSVRMKRLLCGGLILLIFTAACAKAPPQTISEQPLHFLTEISGSGLFAANQDGTKIAIDRNGLSLFTADSKAVQKLSSRQPLAMAWSPDGQSLAAAFASADYETELLLYNADGDLVRAATVPVALSRLTWSRRGDLLACGFILKVYSFGANLRQLLYRIGSDSVEERTLTDSTLRPSLARQIEPLLHKLLPISFSPQGDELVFIRLHDPPEFSPYFQLLYQNWQVVGARELVKLPVQPMSFDWALTADAIVVQSEAGQQTFGLWPAEEKAAELSHTKEDRFSNGRLYSGQRLIVDWGEGAHIQRLAAGRFLLAVNRRLHLGDGLKTRSVQPYDETLWNLRRWRYEELVTPADYQRLRQEITQ